MTCTYITFLMKWEMYMGKLCYRNMRPNLIVFLADMFNVLEIHPVKCVRFDKGTALLTQGQHCETL